MTDQAAILELQNLAHELQPLRPVAARAALLGAQALRDRIAPKPKQEKKDGSPNLVAEILPRLR